MNDNEILLKLGRNICAERNRAGLSQETLAERANMNEKHLGQIERGQINPKITTIIAIMEALNLPFEAFYNK